MPSRKQLPILAPRPPVDAKAVDAIVESAVAAVAARRKAEEKKSEKAAREKADQQRIRLLQLERKEKAKKKDEKPPKNSVKHILSQSYWDSTEAKKYFNTKEGEADAKESLQRRLTLLKKAAETPKGYESLIDVKSEHMHLLREQEIETIKNKIMYLSIAYQYAIDNMNIKMSWSQCCEKTISHMKSHYELIGGSFGFTPMNNVSTLRNLHVAFRQNEKVPFISDANMEKRIKKHTDKKRKLDLKHKQWLERGWARNRKLKKLEKKLETISGEQKKQESDDEELKDSQRYDDDDDEDDEDDDDDDDDDDNENSGCDKDGAITNEEYEFLMLQKY